MVHFFALMLWFAAALAWWAAMPTLAVAIAVVVVLNGAFAFAQEHLAHAATPELLNDVVPAYGCTHQDCSLLFAAVSSTLPGSRPCYSASDA